MSNNLPFLIALASALSAVAGGIVVAQHASGPQDHARSTTLKIPASLKAEHQELHDELSAASNASGRTGAAAGRVAELLRLHFVSEEEYALPPLGLLPALAADRLSPEMREVIPMTDQLKAHLSRMLDEHKAIVIALDDLGRAATAEHHPEVVRFVEKLKLHAENEEQVLYPAAILVGEYLKLKFPS